MSSAAIKSEFPPIDLGDRSEGYGIFGRINGYSSYKDDGIWPATVVRNNPLPTEQPETSDGKWYRNGELI